MNKTKILLTASILAKLAYAQNIIQSVGDATNSDLHLSLSYILKFGWGGLIIYLVAIALDLVNKDAQGKNKWLPALWIGIGLGIAQTVLLPLVK